jgi:hypothetical protein
MAQRQTAAHLTETLKYELADEVKKNSAKSGCFSLHL